jgi:hypothetical protein
MGAAGWNVDVGNAELQVGNVSTDNVAIVSGGACLAFPSDYDSDPASGYTDLFVGIDATG